MILKGKKILIMGVRNKWSIAWGVAQSAIENGAEVIFTHNSIESGEKTEKLIQDIPGAKTYACDVSSDESIKSAFETILKSYNTCVLYAITYPPFPNHSLDNYIPDTAVLRKPSQDSF